MIEIKTLEIAGFASALRALRLPFGLTARSGTSFSKRWFAPNDENKFGNFRSVSNCEINPKDLTLMTTLVKRGDEHAKAIRGVIVYAEINAPLEFWNEADTYRVGTDRLSSSSTMHTIGNGGLTINDFSVPPIIKEVLGEKSRSNKTISPLRIDAPEELKSVVREYMGRKYEIWNNGEIYSLPYEIDDILPNGAKRHREFGKTQAKIGKSRNQQGYYQVRLGGRSGKTFSLHRILAEAFVPNPQGFNVVNHKDGNKGNCSISNLEWCTSSYNNKHAYDTGLKESSLYAKYIAYKGNLKYTDEEILSWRDMKGQGLSLKEISERSGASVNTICQYINGHRFDYASEYSVWFNIAKFYEDTINQINDLSAMYADDGDFEHVLRIKEILPSSFMQKRIQYFSYQTLRRIYAQRKDHRLPHWHIFCDWVKTLPFAEELITIGL